ncbi:peptidoglycan DD-metalloendopeptidase family protein [Glutamicibacter sp. JL.03c]|uniref:M23 family metallopeptidase n=1 Tax=Glutamicibacter sp. JL.03c TaxID=2984842 RepID=UPI0021F6D7C6|nr:peptidoglycan DD-metalloendopeptidase family protein [Glutamicibacter sp. JL.03c]UYQ77830.1 peptidoglycan DD-metalloendopeptidase family protein [Glutamicibacter sp. JL.03c]
MNHDLLLPGLPRRKNPVVIWSTSIVAALGLTGALAIPIVAQPADSRQGDVEVSMDAVADYSLTDGPIFVSADAPLNAFGASGKDLAIDGRPLGMIEGAAETSESSGSGEESTALLAGTVGELGKLPGDLQLMHPVTTRRISSPYGWRANPTGPGNQIHIGQDYPISCGSPVYASEDGTVSVSAWAGHSGMRVTIDHGFNVQTGYSHNSKLIAKVGQRVKQGELIALAGTTGNSTGCHVHFEVIIDGRWHDPRNYLPLIPGQRQAMIDSQRLTVNANTAPKGNGSQNSGQSNNAPDPDIIVPENDETPYIPAPTPRPAPTKSAKPAPSQSEGESESPTGTKSPSDSTSPSENESESPTNNQSPTAKPTPTKAPSKTSSPEGTTTPPPSTDKDPDGQQPSSPAPTTNKVPHTSDEPSTTKTGSVQSPTGSSSSFLGITLDPTKGASLSASITE